MCDSVLWTKVGDGLAKWAMGMLGPSGWWQCWEETTICILPMIFCCYLHNTSACGRFQSRQEEKPFSKKRVRSDGAGALWGTIPLASPGCLVAYFHFQVLERVLFCWRPWFLHLNGEVEFYPSSEILGFRGN